MRNNEAALCFQRLILFIVKEDNRMKHRKLALIGSVILAAAMVTGAFAGEAETLKIGLVCPISGNSAIAGKYITLKLKLWDRRMSDYLEYHFTSVHLFIVELRPEPYR